MHFVSEGLTDKGRKRPGNEDAFVCRNDLGLFAVADGMGGHAAGEVASSTAIDVVSKSVANYFSKEATSEGEMNIPEETGRQILAGAVLQANEKICSLGSQYSELDGMGTTFSGILLRGANIWVCHVGDSRVYLHRDNQLRLLTCDHSWVQEQLQRNLITPEEARTHRWRNVITRALGHKLSLEVDCFTQEVFPGDVYLLCSDGLSGMVEDALIEKTLQDTPALEDASRQLIHLANEAGGHDNITVVLLKITD